MAKISQPVTTQPLDLKIPHDCCHCGRSCEITVRVGGVVSVHEPKRPSLQVVGALDGDVDRIMLAAKAEAAG